MKPSIIKLITALTCLTAMLLFQSLVLAQDDTPTPAPDQITRRPAPEFDHKLHEDALKDPGCGVCHHVFDDETEQLVYSEDEEGPCIDCHMEEKEDGIPAIREANHGSCNACHRDLKKLKKPAGPTTCGECHKKQS